MASVWAPLADGEIRVATLLPGPPSSPICCTLHKVLLTEAEINFNALSWTWGPRPWLPSTIIVDGQPIRVRPNLIHALRALRAQAHGCDEKIWVDAICINQNDLDEKNRQVPLMSRIYRAAKLVIIWLGNPRDDSEYVLDCIRHSRQQEYELPRFYSGMVALCSREWFRRAWIVQEFSLNDRTPELACGIGPRVSWSSFVRIALLVIENTSRGFVLRHGPSMPSRDMIPIFYYLSGLRQNRDGINHRPDLRTEGVDLTNMTLKQAVLLGRYSRATDARDKIWAFLGLLDEGTRTNFINAFPVDYKRKKRREVYQDATLFMLLEEKVAGMYVDYHRLRAKDSKCPSWVLDFDGPDRSTATPLFDIASEPGYYLDQIQFKAERGSIVVKAIELGRISQVAKLRASVSGFVDGVRYPGATHPIYIAGLLGTVIWNLMARALGVHNTQLSVSMTAIYFLVRPPRLCGHNQVDDAQDAGGSSPFTGSTRARMEDAMRGSSSRRSSGRRLPAPVKRAHDHGTRARSPLWTWSLCRRLQVAQFGFLGAITRCDEKAIASQNRNDIRSTELLRNRRLGPLRRHDDRRT